MNTEKKIEQYLHYYIGCQTNVGELIGVDQSNAIVKMADGSVVAGEKGEVKPLLSKLEDMTEEDWLKCFELSRGVVDQAYPSDKITQLSTTERMIVLGKGQFVFGWHLCSDNDVRLGYGVCFYLKSYLIEESISVSDSGIEASDSLYNNMKEEQVLNVTHILHYLLKKGYDLWNLVESGLAIDKKTLK